MKLWPLPQDQKSTSISTAKVTASAGSIDAAAETAQEQEHGQGQALEQPEPVCIEPLAGGAVHVCSSEGVGVASGLTHHATQLDEFVCMPRMHLSQVAW